MTDVSCSQNSPAPATPTSFPERAVPRLHPVVVLLGKIVDHWSVNLLQNAALGIVTLDSLISAYRKGIDPWNVVCAVVVYGALMLFVRAVRALETARPSKRMPLVLTVCALAVFLVSLFSYKVSSMMPLGFAVAVWILSGLTVVVCCFTIIVYGSLPENAGHSRVREVPTREIQS